MTGTITDYINSDKVSNFLFKTRKKYLANALLAATSHAPSILSAKNLSEFPNDRLRLKIIGMKGQVYCVSGGKPIKQLYSEASVCPTTVKIDHINLFWAVYSKQNCSLKEDLSSIPDPIKKLNFACKQSDFCFSGEIHLEKHQNRYKVVAVQGDPESAPGKFSSQYTDSNQIKDFLIKHDIISKNCSNWTVSSLSINHKSGNTETLYLLRPDQDVFVL